MKDAPKTIYLQVCDMDDCCSRFDEHEGVTWCQDKINDSDIEYTRADISQQRTWVGLTDEEMNAEAAKEEQAHGFVQGAAWAEAKLKELNT